MKIASIHDRQQSHHNADASRTPSTVAEQFASLIKSVPAVGSPDPERTHHQLTSNDGSPSLSDRSLRRSK